MFSDIARFMNLHRPGSNGGRVLFRVLLGGLGLVGAFVSMALAFLICMVSQEERNTKMEWGILLGVIFVCSVVCLLLAVRHAKPQR